MQGEIHKTKRLADIWQHDQHSGGDIGKGGECTEFCQRFEFFHSKKVDRGSEYESTGSVADKEGQAGNIQPPTVGIHHISENQPVPELIEPEAKRNQKNGAADPQSAFHGH